jgi:hypothetical protein
VGELASASPSRKPLLRARGGRRATGLPPGHSLSEISTPGRESTAAGFRGLPGEAELGDGLRTADCGIETHDPAARSVGRRSNETGPIQLPDSSQTAGLPGCRAAWLRGSGRLGGGDDQGSIVVDHRKAPIPRKKVWIALPRRSSHSARNHCAAGKLSEECDRCPRHRQNRNGEKRDSRAMTVRMGERGMSAPEGRAVAGREADSVAIRGRRSDRQTR